MNRRLDICRNCSCFANDESCGDICKQSDDIMEMLFFDISNTFSSGLGIPRDFFDSSNEKAKSFEEKELPADCVMKAEYLMSEWNNEKKN